MTVYIPKNIDLDSIVEKATMNNKGPKKDYLAFVLGVVSNGLYIQKDEYERYNENGTPIWTPILKKFIGDKYKIYLDFLVTREILQTNKQFFEGRSRIYSFTSEYSKSFKPFKITDSYLIRKVHSYYAQKNKYLKRKLSYLHKWTKDGRLSIDISGAEAILPLKYNQKLNDSGRKSKERKKEIANIALYCWKRNIDSIHSKKYIHTFSTGESGGGRIYTELTHTSRSFRKFITYHGKKLCHVDIANSQPYFASLLLRPEFWFYAMMSSKDLKRLNKKKGFHGILKGPGNIQSQVKKMKISPNIKRTMIYEDYVDIVTFLKRPQQSVIQEFNKYKKYVSSGNFYQLVAEEYNIQRRPSKQATRDNVKKWMFGVFFSKLPPIIIRELETPQTKVFRKLFPTVNEIFEVIKSEKHNTLAILLQNLESQAILHHICGLISQKHPKIPLFTIHDSIVTTVGNEAIVERIMRDELEKLTGLPPTLRIKTWDDSYDE